MSAAVLDACNRVDSVDMRAISSSQGGQHLRGVPARAPGQNQVVYPCKLEVIEDRMSGLRHR